MNLVNILFFLLAWDGAAILMLVKEAKSPRLGGHGEGFSLFNALLVPSLLVVGPLTAMTLLLVRSPDQNDSVSS